MNNNSANPLNQGDGIEDYGPEPIVVDINEVTKNNSNFRSALWTGEHLQVVLMSINEGESIGVEAHPNSDQFIRIVGGQGLAMIGDTENNLDFQVNVHNGYAIIIPAGKWHNLINTGFGPIKLYTIYAPPQHAHGTVHETKKDSEKAESSK